MDLVIGERGFEMVLYRVRLHCCQIPTSDDDDLP